MLQRESRHGSKKEMKDKTSKEGPEKESLEGKVSVAFEMRMRGNEPLFVHHGVVRKFTDILRTEAENRGCIISVYCFMPDHQHFIVSGVRDSSDALQVAEMYKLSTGNWMSKHIPKFAWDTDHRDYVIGAKEALAEKVKYILDSPVRDGLVSEWQEYPFKGSLGCSLEDTLTGTV